jgi:hypothetical protein
MDIHQHIFPAPESGKARVQICESKFLSAPARRTAPGFGVSQSRLTDGTMPSKITRQAFPEASEEQTKVNRTIKVLKLG